MRIHDKRHEEVKAVDRGYRTGMEGIPSDLEAAKRGWDKAAPQSFVVAGKEFETTGVRKAVMKGPSVAAPHLFRSEPSVSRLAICCRDKAENAAERRALRKLMSRPLRTPAAKAR